MKAVVEQAHQIVERLYDRAAAAEREASRLKGFIEDIPEEGGWVPLRLKVSTVNPSITLEEEKASGAEQKPAEVAVAVSGG